RQEERQRNQRTLTERLVQGGRGHQPRPPPCNTTRALKDMLMDHARARMSDVVKRGLYYGGAFNVSRRLHPRSRAVILRYHSVTEDADTPLSYIDPGLSVPVDGFDRQMRLLREHYTPVSLGHILECILEGRALPHLAVAVTFDDGYLDNYRCAFPVLKKYGVPATFYITAGCVEQPEPLWPSRRR